MSNFRHGSGDWTRYRSLPGLVELDFHPRSGDADHAPYWDRMEKVYRDAVEALRRAQTLGKQHVLFTHGWSTSRLGKTTSRSQVRKAMRSKDATPFIVRSECIQHDSVFVAAIRPLSISD